MIANSGDLALSVFIAVVLGGGFVLLGFISWIFWRAAKREAAETKSAREIERSPQDHDEGRDLLRP